MHASDAAFARWLRREIDRNMQSHEKAVSLPDIIGIKAFKDAQSEAERARVLARLIAAMRDMQEAYEACIDRGESPSQAQAELVASLQQQGQQLITEEYARRDGRL